MKQLGIVKEINGNIIIVKVFKDTGCSHCDSCSEGDKFSGEYSFTSDEKYLIGDEVSFEMDDKTIFNLGLLIYILPILSLFLFYYISSLFSIKEGIKILCSFLGVAFTFLIIFIIDKVKGKHIVDKNISIDKCK